MKNICMFLVIILLSVLVPLEITYSQQLSVANSPTNTTTCNLEPFSLGLIQAEVNNPIMPPIKRFLGYEEKVVQPEEVFLGIAVPAITMKVPIIETEPAKLIVFIKPAFSFAKIVVQGQPGIEVTEKGQFGFITPFTDQLTDYIKTIARPTSESCETSIDGISAGLSSAAPPAIWYKVDVTARFCKNVPTTCGTEFKCDPFGCGPRPKFCDTVAVQDIASGKIESNWQLNLSVQDESHIRFDFSQPLPPSVTSGGGDVYNALKSVGIVDVLQSIGLLPSVTKSLNESTDAALALTNIPVPEPDYIYKPKLSPEINWVLTSGDGGQPYRAQYTRVWTQKEKTVCSMVDCLRKAEGAMTFPVCL